MMKNYLYPSFVIVFITMLSFSCSKKPAEPLPFGAVPTEHQVTWQQMEYYMFIHFGPNTFTDVEWGNGKEDPKIFQPTNLDCRQWASTAKEAGMKGIIITAKHHDGFCLWPSNYSTHTIRESGWKEGKGDILKELSEACKEYGLKFGVYLSPWDRNHVSYGTPEYNQIFANTLTEVLSNYGDIFEQWFDGANGENEEGKKQIYDWDLFNNIVYTKQPQAIIFSDVGPGCRWIGNEKGHAGETNWSTLNTAGFEPGLKAPSSDILNTGNINGEFWVPGEADVSIRPGWFYSPSTDDKVKTVDELMNIYYASVGHNCNLLLNVPPDRTGRIHKNDSIRLMEFRDARNKVFGTNLAAKAKIVASNTRGNHDAYSPQNLVDNNYNSYWATDDNVSTANLEMDLGETKIFNCLSLQEYIPLGQRIADFSVEYYNEKTNIWDKLVSGTTIGYKRILRFPTISTSRLKININKSLACPTLSCIELFKAPEELFTPIIRRNKEGYVSLLSHIKDMNIYYTTDGTTPERTSKKYIEPIFLPGKGIIKAITVNDMTNDQSEVASEVYDIAPIKWQITPTSAEGVIDGIKTSFVDIDKKESIIINLGEVLNLKGFTYSPLNDIQAPNVFRYNFYISDDGKSWYKLKNNSTFDNIKNNPIDQRVLFDKTIKTSYIKFEPIEITSDSKTYTIAEIGVISE